MAKSLKDQNKPALLTAVAANITVLYGAIQTGALFVGDPLLLARGWQALLPAGLGLILLGIANAQIHPDNKARIVFARRHEPLPGSEAFSRLGPNDPRVDMASVTKMYGPFPHDRAGQNKRWYALYKTVAMDPSVDQVHREFLFCRDYATLALMMLPLLGGIGLFAISSIGTSVLYLLFLIAQFLLTRRAARAHGRRLVTTVLALKGAGK